MDLQKDMEAESVVRISDSGFEYSIYLPDNGVDYIQTYIFNQKLPYERDMLVDMCARLQEGDIVLDVGANVGNHTLYLAGIGQARVLAFEPNQHLADAICQSVALNHFQDRIQVNIVGVGERGGVAAFDKEVPDNLGAQALTLGEGPIEIVALDEQQIDRPVRMIKIDVEGMELPVLKGAETIIRRDSPIIYIECADEDSFQGIVNFLGAFGYYFWATFNATPTHLFMLANEVTPQKYAEYAQGQAINAASRAYKEKLEAQRLRESLNSANLKYRNIIMQYDQKKAETEALKGEFDDRIGKLKHEIIDLNDKLASAVGEARRKDEELDVLQTKLAEMPGLSYRLDVAEGALHRLEAKRGELDDGIDGLNYKISYINNKLKDAAEALEKKEKEILSLRSELDQIPRLKHDLTVSEGNFRKAEQQIAELNSGVAGLNSKIDELSGRLDDFAAEIEKKDEIIRALQSELNEIPRLKQSLIISEQNLRKSEQKNSVLINNMLALNESTTFQAGLILRDGAGSLRSALVAPYRLYKLLRKKKPKVSKPQEIAANAMLDAGPSIAKEILPSVGTRSQPIFKPGYEPPKRIDDASYLTALKAMELPAARDLRIACIMDDFTFACFEAEADLLQLSSENWENEISAFKPDMLFVESAWRGKDSSWERKVGHRSRELHDLLKWCRKKGVATAFWNKEDPIHFHGFLNSAKLFDHVFTTDIDCIHLYKRALGHDNVWFLPFACQPRMHNPLEVFERKDAISFAGAYYTRYPDRVRDLETFIAGLPLLKPVDIFDRNFGKDDPRYTFPEAFSPFIVGTLSPKDIDISYKGYRYAINLNSVKQSQSMFARRVYELLASNTVTISNFSRGLRLMFGDLIIATDSYEEVTRRFEKITTPATVADKLRLSALRKIMSEHTAEDRITYVASKLLPGRKVTTSLSEVIVVSKPQSLDGIARVIEAFARQSYENVRCFLIVPSDYKGVKRDKITFLSEEDAADIFIKNISEACWVTYFHEDDHYGSNYLLDLALSARYSAPDAVGKVRHYKVIGSDVVLSGDAIPYSPSSSLALRRALVRQERLNSLTLKDAANRGAELVIEGLNGLAIDPFNYCEDGGRLAGVAGEVDDLENIDTGMTLIDVQDRVSHILPDSEPEQVDAISPQDLLRYFDARGTQNVRITSSGDTFELTSDLADGKHEYIYSTIDIRPEKLAKDGMFRCFADKTPGLNVSFVLFYFDEAGKRIGASILECLRNETAVIPEGTSNIRLGLRVLASGSAEIKQVALQHRNFRPATVLDRPNILILTNTYPSYDNLYRNGFVHTRVRSYAAQGVRASVFCLKENSPQVFSEFENVDVQAGGSELLDVMLASGQYKTVAVHFLDPSMWAVLKHHLDKLKIVVWVHGAEVQPWWRREYNYNTPEQLAVAKMQSHRRIEFWQEVFSNTGKNIKFVFVSRYFANEVMEDTAVSIEEDRYDIIHNPIDTSIFVYKKKDSDYRKRLLSIRPFASRKYANDLTVEAILLLSEKPYFDDLDITIMGEGQLFEETLQPLMNLPNVTIKRGFLQHEEISHIHAQNGIFLVPTRMDSQGVSRDEAMASGLVPVTNAVTAIPEFVDETCGILVPAEDAQAMADGIERLYLNPELFQKLSAAAAQRVRRQSAADVIVKQEIALLLAAP